jgi:hypothetical protein
VALRFAAPALAAIALVTSLAGAGGFASFVLLAAIVAASARLLVVVGDMAEGNSDRWPVVMSIGGLVCLVAAGAAHVPLLVLGLLACTALELLGSPAARPHAVAEPVDLAETPISRAA